MLCYGFGAPYIRDLMVFSSLFLWVSVMFNILWKWYKAFSHMTNFTMEHEGQKDGQIFDWLCIELPWVAPIIPHGYDNVVIFASQGLLKLHSLITLLWKNCILLKYKLDSSNRDYICQVSLQLSCSDTCQIWSRYSVGKQCLLLMKNGKINRTEEMGFVAPTPCRMLWK